MESDKVNTYIKLITNEQLSKEDLRAWYDLLKDYAPSGILTTIQSTDQHGQIRSVCVVAKKENGKYEYTAPLVRNLNDKEGEEILQHMDFPFDFNMEISSNVPTRFYTDINIPEDKFQTLCSTWARQKHEAWVKDRLDSGWRYGTTISVQNKTHPLLRPWHELPEKFREIDDYEPKSLLKLLNDSGYVLLNKDEIESLSKILK